jgi:outer membrane protein TolC
VLTATSSLLPSVRVQSTHSKFQTPFTRVIGEKVIETDQAYSASINVGETVTFGGLMGVLESAAAKGAAAYYLENVRQEVAFIAKQEYLDVLRAQRLLGVAEEAVDLSGRRLEKAEAMVEVGSAVRSDVLRAQVEVSMNELELISARNRLRLAETGLRHLLGLEDGVTLQLEDILETEEIEYVLEDAIAKALSLRPDIRSASESLRSAQRGLWRQREWSWHLTVGIDLFDGLYTFSRVRRAKALSRSAEEDLAQVKRDAILEIRQAFYNVEEARQRVRVSEQTVSLAEEELRLAEERYRLGGATMLEQIDSQVALSEARTSHIEALYDLMLSQAQMELAVGRSN